MCMHGAEYSLHCRKPGHNTREEANELDCTPPCGLGWTRAAAAAAALQVKLHTWPSGPHDLTIGIHLKIMQAKIISEMDLMKPFESCTRSIEAIAWQPPLAAYAYSMLV